MLCDILPTLTLTLRRENPYFIMLKNTGLHCKKAHENRYFTVPIRIRNSYVFPPRRASCEAPSSLQVKILSLESEILLSQPDPAILRRRILPEEGRNLRTL